MKTYHKLFSFIIFVTIIFTFNGYCLALKCTVCATSDKDCTINPQKIEAKDCKEEEKICFMKLNDEGQVERGCGAEDFCGKITNKEECDVCKDAASCNKIFPEKRPKCYVCSGKDCLKVNPENFQYCQFYKKDQTKHCFTNTEDNDNVIRDCLEGYKGKCEGDNCKKCSNGDSNEPCNKNEVVPPPFSCYTCRSDADAECEYAARDKAKVVACKDSSKGCYSERFDGKTFRACAEILDQKETEACKATKNNNCKICDKTKCNGAKMNSGTIKSISVILMISSILLTGKFFN